MDPQEHQEPLVDVILMVDQDRMERLVEMEETGEHQVVIRIIVDQEDHQEEQSQVVIIA